MNVAAATFIVARCHIGCVFHVLNAPNHFPPGSGYLNLRFPSDPREMQDRVRGAKGFGESLHQTLHSVEWSMSENFSEELPLLMTSTSFCEWDEWESITGQRYRSTMEIPDGLATHYPPFRRQDRSPYCGIM